MLSARRPNSRPTIKTWLCVRRRWRTPAQREHVTPYLRRDPATLPDVRFDADLSHLRWTLDTAADYALIAEIYDRLYVDKPAFTWLDVLALVTREPRLITLNLPS